MSDLAGVDLNGLWDLAAIRDSDSGDLFQKDGGVNGAVIRLEKGDGDMVAGAQTEFAPHGRGQGWGSLGDSQFRFQISDCIAALIANKLNDEQRKSLIVLLNELTGDARSLVVAVPDNKSFPEGARERLIQVLKQSQAGGCSLLWRPVSAALGWLIADREVSTETKDGAKVAILSILRDGVHFGELTLESEEDRKGHFFVPVRHQQGKLVIPDLGGQAMAQSIADQLAAVTGVDAKTLLVESRSPWRCAVGKKSQQELYRMSNRSWRILPKVSPRDIVLPMVTLDTDIIDRLRMADIILLEGAAAKSDLLRQRVFQDLQLDTDDPRLQVLEKDTVAKGCLEANERMRQGRAIYYDFLPQLEINALEGDRPTFVSLIPKGERLKGGETYRAKAPTNFSIGQGADTLKFYLIKEDYDKARYSEESLAEISNGDHPITVTVEQSPGQGYVKVRISSDSFQPLRTKPVELSWENMSIVEDDREAILAGLQGSGNTAYPDAQIMPGHVVLWHLHDDGHEKWNCLKDYLDKPLVSDGAVNSGTAELVYSITEFAAKRISPSYIADKSLGIQVEMQESTRFLNSDGSFPAETDGLSSPKFAEEILGNALMKAEQDFHALRTLDDYEDKLQGKLIGFMTWCFWRCPESVVSSLLDWYENDGTAALGGLRGRIEGMGRAIHKAEDLDRFMQAIDLRFMDSATMRSFEFSALGRILGSVNITAKIMEPDSADRFLKMTCELIHLQNNAAQNDAYKLKFKAALLMLAALLRHRAVRPQFLSPDGISADVLCKLLEKSRTRIDRMISSFERQARNSEDRNRQKLFNTAKRLRKVDGIIEELVQFINEEGRDPNIIRRIDALDDG